MGLFGNLVARINLLIYQYEVCTSIAMMSYPEKVVINSVFLGVIATILYSSYVFLPHYTWRLLVVCGILAPPEGTSFDDVLLMPTSGSMAN